MSSPLDDAIHALKLAKECGGDEDLAQYEKAHQDLVCMRDSIIAHDKQLNEQGKAPDGDDYNKLWSLLGLPASAKT